MMNSKLIIPFIVCLRAFSISAGAAQAQTEVQVQYQWTAPTTGSPVDHYVVEHSVNGGAWTQIATTSADCNASAATAVWTGSSGKAACSRTLVSAEIFISAWASTARDRRPSCRRSPR